MSDLSATNQCVKCGLCLPHCPTFAITGNEASSPRGRITLMQAIDRPDTQWSPGLLRHLDECLQCGACEAMCPSKVPFVQLMDRARARLEPHRERTWLQRTLREAGLDLVASADGIQNLAPLIRLYQVCGLQALVAALPFLPEPLKRLNRLLPKTFPSAATVSPPVTATRGEVALFGGCISSLFDRQTQAGARQLLEQLGYRVTMPERQGCCGALHLHNGDPDAAARLANANLSGFAASDAPILVTASGCSAHLRDYGKLYKTAPAVDFSERVSDILNFLVSRDHSAPRFKPLDDKVAVYVPCSHRNSLRQQQDIVQALNWIPGIRTEVLNAGGGCCGAAGSYMLSQPALSDQLREPVIDKIQASGARLLVTSNIGCSLQLQAGVKARGLDVEVLHPVVLLARQLEAKES